MELWNGRALAVCPEQALKEAGDALAMRIDALEILQQAKGRHLSLGAATTRSTGMKLSFSAAAVPIADAKLVR